MSYQPHIDGLRAIAVLAVIFFHAGFEYFKGGYLGVDIFFVISGYLITSIILADIAADRFSLLRFYERRARRILPALIVVLSASLAIATAVLPPQPFADMCKSLIATALFVANVFFWDQTNYFSEPAELAALLHMWSLSVEEQFYILFPLILIGLSKTALRVVVSVGLATSLIWAALHHRSDPASVFYLAHFRAWELLIGAVLALAQLKFGKRQSTFATVAGIAIIIAAITLTNRTNAFVGSIAATMGTALVIYFAGANAASRVLTSSPLRAIGLISYSLYLWHQPIFVFARFYMLDAPTAAGYLALTALSAALAAVTWICVERPARKVASHVFVLTTTSCAGLLVGAVVLGLLTDGFPARYTAEQLAILGASPERGVAIRDGRPCRRGIVDACIIGDPAAKPSFAVLGDSHAEALTEPLSEIFKFHGLSAFVYTNAGCPFIAGAVGIEGGNSCDIRTREVLKELEVRGITNAIVHDRIAAYMLGAFDNGEGGIELGKVDIFAPLGFVGSDEQRVFALHVARRKTILGMLNSGVTIYYVAPVPEVGWHVPRTLTKAIAQNRLPLTTSLARYLERQKIALSLARELAKNQHFIPIYPHELFCDEERCHTHSRGEIFYTDTDHLSTVGARIVVRSIADALGQHLEPARAYRRTSHGASAEGLRVDGIPE